MPPSIFIRGGLFVGGNFTLHRRIRVHFTAAFLRNAIQRNKISSNSQYSPQYFAGLKALKLSPAISRDSGEEMLKKRKKMFRAMRPLTHRNVDGVK